MYTKFRTRPASPDHACVVAMHGDRNRLARIQLEPLPPDAESFGPDFLATCAPDSIFFPITDILNVALVQTESKFGLATLRQVGDKASFAAFSTTTHRSSVDMIANAPGGETQISNVTSHKVVVDWVPLPMHLVLTEHAASGDFIMTGLEHFAFRIQVDRTTGKLISAKTLYDTLNLVMDMPGVPKEKAPHITIRRTVNIKRKRE